MKNPPQIPRLSRRTFLAAPVTAFAAGCLITPTTESLAVPMDDSPYILNPAPADRKLRPITSLRTFEGGFHNGPTTHFDHFDPEDFVRRVKAAQTECMVVQAKSMWGYAYYDTKVGTRHPNLDYDLVARMIDLGHRNGLTVVAYYSGTVDMQSAHQASRVGRDQRRRRADLVGEPVALVLPSLTLRRLRQGNV